MQKQKLIFVCGLSGAGRSTALKVLEDCGFHPIDNLPVKFIPRLFGDDVEQERIALGFTPLTAEDAQEFEVHLADLRARVDVDLVFLDARPNVLVRRYSETRRLHPFTQGRPLQEAITEETNLLERLKAQADLVIDTSNLTPHDLKAELKHKLNIEQDHPFQVQVMSFSFKRGVPISSDFVFDCRFLKNPHWDEKLRPNDGRDQAVVDYISTDPVYQKYSDDIENMLGYVIPRVQDEGRSYATISFGCSGGRHRSVAFAEKTYKTLKEAGFRTLLTHRELE